MPIRRKIKNSVGYYSAAELLVRQATSNDPTEPDEMILLKIADCTKLPSYYLDTTKMLWKRLNDKNKNWRHIYKALIAIDVCLINGSYGFVKECQSQLPQFITLSDFQNIFDNSEYSQLIRERAKRVVSLLKDETLLKQERKEKMQNRRNRSTNNSFSVENDSMVDRFRHSISSSHSSNDVFARNDMEEKELVNRAISLSLREGKTAGISNSENISQDSVRINSLLNLEENDAASKFDSWLQNRYLNTSIYSSDSNTSTFDSPGLNDQRRQQPSTSRTTEEHGMPNILEDFDGLHFDFNSRSSHLASMDENPFSVENEVQPQSINGNSLHDQSVQQMSDILQRPASNKSAFLGGFGKDQLDFENLIKPAPAYPTNRSEPNYPFNDNIQGRQSYAGLVSESCLNDQRSTPQTLDILHPTTTSQSASTSKNFLNGFGDNLVDLDNLLTPVAVSTKSSHLQLDPSRSQSNPWNSIQSSKAGILNYDQGYLQTSNQMPSVFNQPNGQLQLQMQQMMTHQGQRPMISQTMQQPMILSPQILQPTPINSNSFSHLNKLSSSSNPFL